MAMYKEKVRLVLDYRELNEYVDAYTAHADACWCLSCKIESMAEKRIQCSRAWS